MIGRNAKGRVTILAENLLLSLQNPLSHAKTLHDDEVRAGSPGVWLPNALAIKYPHVPAS